MRDQERQRKSLPACVVVLAALLLGGCAGAPPRETGSPSADAAALGIEMVGVHRSAAGYMLDVRYRVVDAERAAPLVDRKIRPYLMDQSTGARLFVPSSAKIGPLRQTGARAREGQIYFTLFANPGRYVDAGRKVTLVVGDRQVRDLTVME